MTESAILLMKKISNLFDERNYSKLRQLLDKELSVYKSENIDDAYTFAEIAGAYISLGSETFNEASVNIGLKLFQDNRDKLFGRVTQDSIEYCLANGYHALYKIEIKDQPEWFITPEIVKGNLFEAKQCYLKSFKLINIKELDDFSIQVLTNLGNNLNHSGRIVEALQLFDQVLKYNPNFPQALVSKADGLRYMIQATKCRLSISAFAEIYNLYQKALIQNPIFPKEIEEQVHYNLERTIQILKDNDFDISQAEKEFELNHLEYQGNSEELKFYLDNFLSLSEHSLYCKCNGANIDDLSIGYEGFDVTSKKVMDLEHLLNRIKSEFAFARKQLFEFRTTQVEDIVFYQNFGVHKLIYGVQSEKLRISFRMCFGILDKIAQGVLYLFDLEKGNRENTYFESFWKNKQAPEGRWEKFNEVKNSHLTALYSIACDLSKHNGEFSFYKQWRNQLEHDIFTLIPSDISQQDFLNSKLFSESITIDEFEDKATYLMQVVRSAIFSFTFCCREEVMKEK